MDYALELDFPGSADAAESLIGDAIDLNLPTPMSWGSSLPSPGGRSAPDGPLRTRVCDLCISKKVKCDMKRPACSRCLENGRTCVYSTLRKRPGPVRGFRKHAVIAVRSSQLPVPDNSGEALLRTLQADQVSLLGLDSACLDAISSPQHVLAEATCDFWQALGSWPTPVEDQPNGVESSLTFEHERELLNNFFDHIHSSIPLFRRDKFFRQFESGVVARDLLLVISALTVKILGRRELRGVSRLEERLKHLLERNGLDSETSAARWSLDDFRQACLLAYYEFHEHPGERAWSRVGHLTRKAYYCGLHQLDNHDLCDGNDGDDDDDDDKEEWRYVWWCIFCLDSYSNITAASPFVVHVESIRTSLITNPGRERGRKAQILLPGQPEMFWQTVEAITSHGHNVNFNLHIVTTAILREVATLYRLWWQNPWEGLKRRLGALENHLTAVRLALPPRYMNVARNALHDEPCSAYHARLICLLHLHVSRLLICLPLHPQKSEEQRLCLWHKTLEYCQDIVDVIKQWDSQHSPSVDPAVCFIVYTALVILNLHYNTLASSEPELQVTLGTQINILRLFLEQFAFFWNLPRFLISK
ncbi:hypothetical protein B0J13DRAFT_494232 [Dactylonectria estremocensis]|uniref:Zn(2)-C6 fungal-type domain-containing protein n=1 Tax=Dactylonectria estremocensis TaxID=1079267 RepID=A0A9P9FF80_9HYPO|nr:hypothetical protein B0J13DRAFT_494232 [Dactylonectria estremocensis]